MMSLVRPLFTASAFECGHQGHGHGLIRAIFAAMVKLVLGVCHIDFLGLARCGKTHNFM